MDGLLGLAVEHGIADDLLAEIAGDRVGALVGNARQVTHANGYYLEQIAYTREELRAGVPWVKLTPVEHIAADLRGIGEARARGRSAPYEKEYARRDLTRRRLQLILIRFDDDLLLGITANEGDEHARRWIARLAEEA
jgi:PAS domain-containing protein